ncbi:Helix-turn-helix domain-containing protein [Lentzea xinjiangensis]|uniref:Helix-turn-helix domain-containing protein n=1 Tax=Lentzea xinjiangensis TaxID=402600 RepID=A0A1H9L707_9PSEU|nr:helix-turn-helix transcriptional regulator [Lentzea xinjiangensis]SER07098.1 Helix-turn-helix domain-containing protein [Lentzea xinjiangensis]
MADNALGRFLRARREATTPPAGTGRRRTPGLRRGELADRAGISVEYLTRLERGTDRSPSGQVLASLADALAMTADERVHLYRLIKAGSTCAPAPPPPLRPTLLAVLDSLSPAAACVLTPSGDVLACNEAFRAISGMGEERNLVRFTFSPEAKAHYPDWDRIAHDRAAALRAAADLGDHAAAVLAFELSITAGATFTDRYDAAAALPPATGTERWGPALLVFETLHLPGEGEHRVMVYFSQH